jgi:hypothetical protein
MLPLPLPGKIDKAAHIETVGVFLSEPRIVYPTLCPAEKNTTAMQTHDA